VGCQKKKGVALVCSTPRGLGAGTLDFACVECDTPWKLERSRNLPKTGPGAPLAQNTQLLTSACDIAGVGHSQAQGPGLRLQGCVVRWGCPAPSRVHGGPAKLDRSQFITNTPNSLVHRPFNRFHSRGSTESASLRTLQKPGPNRPAVKKLDRLSGFRSTNRGFT